MKNLADKCKVIIEFLEFFAPLCVTYITVFQYSFGPLSKRFFKKVCHTVIEISTIKKNNYN